MKILKDEKENFTMKTNKYSGTKTEQNLRTAFSGESEAQQVHLLRLHSQERGL